MNLSQADRNALRASQHLLNSHAVIGNIIEHRSQNPKTYKKLSNTGSNDQPLELGKKPEAKFDLTRVMYKSKFLDNNPVDQVTSNHQPLESIEENHEMEYPIAPGDVNANLWLNMDNFEFDKLEWMSNKADKLYHEQLKSTTRFDKEGRAIPSSSADERIVNGHDEGHDIGSLVNLLDSAYQPQTTYALNVISKIASLATMGYYDGAFDENVHDILIKDCLLRVRHCLDSPNESICQSAIKCLRALLCNTQVDEIVLDRIYPIISDGSNANLWLQTNDMKFKEFSIEMKDHECVKIDPIQTLIQRTDLITRFNHLLQVKSGLFSDIYYECILDILIRIARHSTGVCQELNPLLDSILKLFLPVEISSETKPIRNLSIKALKLIRIIAESIHQRTSRTGLTKCKIPNSIMPVLESYFCIDCFGDFSNSVKDSHTNFKLHIECLRALKALYRIAEFQRGIESLFAMCSQNLHKNLRSLGQLSAIEPLDELIAINWQFAAHLIDLAGLKLLSEKLLDNKSLSIISWSLLTPILLKWSAEVIRSQMVPHLDISITIATAINGYKSRFNENKANDELEEILFGTTQSGKNISAEFFKLLCSKANEQSQLQNFLTQNGCLRDPKGLSSFGQLNYNTSPEYEFKLNSLVDHWSPFILLNMFIEWKYKFVKRRPHDLKIFFDNGNMIRYLKCITGYHKLDMNYELQVHQSFSAQYEVRLLTMAILLTCLYYLEAFGWSDDDDFEKLVDESESIEDKECYGNFMNYAISVIGLLCTNNDFCIRLKDQIFEKVLLNPEIESRLDRQVTVSQNRRFKYRRNWDTDFVNGESKCPASTSKRELYTLLPVYLSYEHTNRYWMLQPLLDYYRISVEGGEKSRDNQWFVKNLTLRSHTGELACSSDANIISTVLKFNTTLIRQSAPYNYHVVKHSVEDYLCIVGSLFLHDDLFLDTQVQMELSRNIRTVLCESLEVNNKCQVPFREASKVIQPLNLPLADYFNKFVDQFEAVSYGDAAFSNFLLLFLAPQSDKIFRKKLFQEKAETCLSQLRIHGDEIWVPQELLFSDREKDPEIKEILRRAGPYLPPKEISFVSAYRNFHIQ